MQIVSSRQHSLCTARAPSVSRRLMHDLVHERPLLSAQDRQSYVPLKPHVAGNILKLQPDGWSVKTCSVQSLQACRGSEARLSHDRGNPSRPFRHLPRPTTPSLRKVTLSQCSELAHKRPVKVTCTDPGHGLSRAGLCHRG